MSYPVKYRERVVEYHKENHTLEETHQVFKVAISTIRKWEKQLKEEGHLENKPLNRGYKKIDSEKLRKYVEEHPDAYQSEMAEVFGCCTSAIQQALKRLKITRKKKTTRYHEQKKEQVETYQAEIEGIPTEKIAYIDECGIDTYLYREYGYAPKGERLLSRISGRKYKRCGIVAAKMAGSILAPLQYKGTMNSALFETWFTQNLLPSLAKGSVIVMDNASFHRKKKLFSIAKEYGCRLIFLPPYSPELNPIEKFWAQLKACLRRILPEYSSFDDALFASFQLV